VVRRWLLGVVVLALLSAGAPAGAAPLATTAPACDDIELVASGDADPVATGACPGVRPGAYVATEGGGGCTFNFVFDGFGAGPEREALGRYIGTAGHCVVGDSAPVVWADGKGPQAFDGDGRHIGNHVFAVNDADRDFAVIKLLPGVESNPAMCHWGGPTGLYEELPTSQVELKHFGQGIGMGETIPARTAWAPRMGSPDRARAWGVVTFGDSGSGVITAAGEAVGVAVTIGFGSSSDSEGTIGITRLPPQLRLAEETLGIDLELVTAPRA
jgi:hypothetical protein